MGRRIRTFSAVLLLATLCSCGDPGPSNAPVASEIPAVLPRPASRTVRVGTPEFAGVRDLVAGPGRVHLRWNAASDDRDGSDHLRYRIYAATRSGRQDFSAPPARTTEPGATHAVLEGLKDGEEVHVVVRAVDRDGNEDFNEAERSGRPGPVRYVSGAASSQDADGVSPENSFDSILAAVRSAIAEESVNIYVQAGEYPGRLILFEGTAIYGGFDAAFDPRTRDPEKQRSRVVERTRDEIVLVAPGTRAAIIDGLELDGEKRTARGVVGKNCTVVIASCLMRGFTDDAVSLETEGELEEPLDAVIVDCIVRENLGEGVQLVGFVDAAIRNSVIESSGKEGIEVRAELVPGGKTRLEVEGCELRGNGTAGEPGDTGVNIDLVANQPDLEGTRCRVTVRDCVVEGSGNHGVSIDVKYPTEESVDLRVKVVGNRLAGNARAGLHLDVDAVGDYRVQRNEISGNHRATSSELPSSGVLLTGDAVGSLVRIHNSVIAKNHGAGVHLAGLAHVLLDDSTIEGNDGPAVSLSEGRVDVSGCLVVANGAELVATTVRYTQFEEDRPRNDVVLMEGVAVAPAQARGNPLQVDAAGEATGVGASGGPVGNGVGPGYGHGPHEFAELVRVSPLPGAPIARASWELVFDRKMTDVEVRVAVDGRPVDGVEVTHARRSVRVGVSRPIEPGARITMEVLPSGAGANWQPWHRRFQYQLVGETRQ